MSHHFGVAVSYCLNVPYADENVFPGGMVASKELRQLIEDLQPGYAKFFPVQLEFKDQVVEGYSWFVQPYRLRHAAQDWTYDYITGKVEARRSKLSGIHWESLDNLKYIFSSEMVRRLEPLILRRESAWLKGLVPVTVIED